MLELLPRAGPQQRPCRHSRHPGQNLSLDRGSEGSCGFVWCPALAGTIALCALTYLSEAAAVPVPEEESGPGHPTALWVASWMQSPKITPRGRFSEALSLPSAALRS